jgi:hypothetical protein
MTGSRLIRACGGALMAAGPLMIVAKLLHPSRETASSILAMEQRLVAAHALYTVASLLILLGLPGLYAAHVKEMRRLGLAGFLVAFTGTYLIAVTGNFGFIAPVLAEHSPTVLDALDEYAPLLAVNGLAAATFIIGYVMFGVAMTRAATLPRSPGLLVAIGGPAHLIGFGISQLASTAAYAIALLGSICLELGLGWTGFRLTTPAVVTTGK